MAPMGDPSTEPTVPGHLDPGHPLDEIDAEVTSGGLKPAGSRRRRRQALIVVGAAIASAVGGVAIGSRLKSPADAANERKAPAASLITVPVERRALTSNLTVAGDVVFEEPTPVRLLGAVGESAGTNQVVTRLPEIGSAVNEGDVLLEVSGRPVFALQGTLPVFRGFEPGSKGPDVAQLEAALDRLGYSPGTVDEVYDEGTEKALDAMYEAKGYASEGPSADQRNKLRDQRKALSDAEESLRKAQNDLRTGGSTVTPSQLLQARQSVDKAQAAIPEAEAAANQANVLAASNVTSAVATRDAAKLGRDAAKTIADAVAQPGAINPDTGEAYSSTEIAERQATLADRERELIDAEKSLNQTISDQTTTKNQGDNSIGDARDALELARAQLVDLQKPADTQPLQEAVTQAQAVVDQATTELFVIEAEVGTKLPAGEVIFLPTLPTNVTNLSTTVGATVSDTLLTVSSTATQITGRVSKNDGNLLVVGAPVTVEIPDAGVETTGTLSQIGAQDAQPADPNGGAGSGAGDSSRLQVIVAPDDPAKLSDFVGYSARIRITVSSTEGEVLAVPVAALSVGPDGASRVEVLRSSASAGVTADTTDSAGSGGTTGNGKTPSVATTEMVTVEVGLTAQGYSEIKSFTGALAEGDRVVIGVEGDTAPSDTSGASVDEPSQDTSTADTSADTSA